AVARRQQARTDAAERARLLYVALTRARRRLVLSGAFPADLARKAAEDRPVRGLAELLARRRGGWPDLAAGRERGETHSRHGELVVVRRK
ncbi:MAG: hypothetical protein AAF533_26875, partial [Acidobacteriota bacterium]